MDARNTSSTNGSSPAASAIALCASCDRCRARKTKCDGARPCGNCAAKYLKKNKLTSIEGIDIGDFQCVYSPAKRRGPVPGKASQGASSGSSRKADEMETTGPTVASSASSRGSNASPPSNSAAAHLIASQYGNTVGDSATNNPDYLLHNHPAIAAALQSRNIDDINQLSALNVGGGSPAATSVNSNPVGGVGAGGLSLNGQNPFMGMSNEEMLNALQQQQRQMMFTNPSYNVAATANMNMMGAGNTHTQAAAAAQQQLNYLQQLQAAIGGGGDGRAGVAGANAESTQGGSAAALKGAGQQPPQSQLQQQQPQQSTSGAYVNMETDDVIPGQPKARKARISPEDAELGGATSQHVPRTVQSHLPLLDKSNGEGNRLRSYYDLSINDLFNLPPIPSNEEYCARLPVPLLSASLLPRFDVAALQAARFAEISLGALVNNQIALALELSNATVMCLRECVEEPVHPSCMYDVARAYFLHGLFRSFRGDMVRYFKYRRVCLTHLNQMDNVPGVEAILGAISFHDAWAYVVHNAEEDSLPNIDDSIPPLPEVPKHQQKKTASEKYGLVSTEPSSIVSDPMNQMWIQGPPPIFINNEAPPLCRSLDALACAVRSCCDQANARFEGMAKEMNASDGAENGSGANGGDSGASSTAMSPTQSAVMSNENELCSRNMVLSAFTLLQQHEASGSNINRNHGHHLIISAMDAFLENADDDEGGGGFTDSQIQSLLSVCNTIIDHPLLLHQGGPIYHMVSNAAILLCHLLNGMHANRPDDLSGVGSAGEMEAALFDEVLDTFISVRKLLSTHRRKLPVRLRCHGIPRPNFGAGKSGAGGEVGGPFIDLGETLMCSCRGCQGFVLMACSPCVAAEKAQAARLRQEVEIREAENGGKGNISGSEVNEFDKELYDLGVEFDLDDDALLNVLSRIIAS